MPNKVVWQWWENPLGGGPEWSDGPPEDKNVPEPYDEDPEEYPIRPVMMTDAGIVPVNVYGDVFEAFDFWMGHTDVNLSKAIIDILRKIDGVETLYVVTRYRFRVSFGLCFESSEVKKRIEEVVATWPKP